MTNLVDQFFFASEYNKKVTESKLQKEVPVFRNKINELSMSEFHSLCEYCLDISSAEVYTGFLKYEEICDLHSLSKPKYKSKNYTKKAYKKTLLEILLKQHPKEIVIWLYLKHN